jgi:hypothetical protein
MDKRRAGGAGEAGRIARAASWREVSSPSPSSFQVDVDAVVSRTSTDPVPLYALLLPNRPKERREPRPVITEGTEGKVKAGSEGLTASWWWLLPLTCAI